MNRFLILDYFQVSDVIGSVFAGYIVANFSTKYFLLAHGVEVCWGASYFLTYGSVQSGTAVATVNV